MQYIQRNVRLIGQRRRGIIPPKTEKVIRQTEALQKMLNLERDFKILAGRAYRVGSRIWIVMYVRTEGQKRKVTPAFELFTMTKM